MENKTAKTKKTQGRRKIEIKKIDNVNHRHVAFSKRRIGIFNKASELCILCGTQVAAIVESYGGKRVFTFGHPSPDAVIQRYLSNSPWQENQDPWNALEKKNELHYHQAWQELEAEKKKEMEKIEERKGGEGGGHWWDLPIEGMNVRELQEYTAALEELKRKAALRVDELETATMMRTNNHTFCCSPSCSLLPSSSSSDPNTMSVLTMLMNNNNDRKDDIKKINDCHGPVLPTYDESDYYFGYDQH